MIIDLEKTNYLVKSHILNIIDLSDYGLENNAKNVLDVFKSEYSHEIKRLGERKAFIEWCKGLPSSINVEFEYFHVNNALLSFGLEVGENDMDNFDMYLDIIYDNLKELCLIP